MQLAKHPTWGLHYCVILIILLSGAPKLYEPIWFQVQLKSISSVNKSKKRPLYA